MNFSGKTTDWKYFEGTGSFFRLIEGTLLAAPANLDGTMDAEADCEVEFENIEPVEQAKCITVGRALESM